jgi:putative transposase
MSKLDRDVMLDRGNIDLSVRRQCALLHLARSGVYRPKATPDPDDLAVMKRIDELYLKMPFYGSRKMVAALRAEGRQINRKRVQRLMQLMGLVALVPRPGTSKAAPGNKIYPYLLRGLTIDRPNHVSAADITYIPWERGLCIWWQSSSGRVERCWPWRLSNTMDTGFCVAALDEALARFGKPDIFNTDQGTQFTSTEFTGRLTAAGIRISMDGRGRWMDNVFIERVWRSLKYEEVYLKAYAGGREARAGIGEWMTFYNNHRFHQALGYKSPMAVWSAGSNVSETAVDMPLRLDNASALPTCPQPQQQKQTASAD